MANKTIIIDESLGSILREPSFDGFTIMQLRDAYLAGSVNTVSFVEARKYIYRQVLRLLKHGVLSKEEASNARETKYYKTKLFSSIELKARQSAKVYKKPAKITTSQDESLERIQEQLNQYKVDLLASVGESEEYMRLYKSNPEFKVLLESKYHGARDHSSKLLGQIKALKTVLSHYSN